MLIDSSSIRLLVKSWLLVVKILRESKVICWVFPGGSEVKNLLANPGNTGSIPDQGGSHVPQSNQAHEQQLSVLEPGAPTTEPRCPRPELGNKSSHHNEKPTDCS